MVKVVTDHAGNALYFSRSPDSVRARAVRRAPYFKHIGLYVYRRDFCWAIPTCRWVRWNRPTPGTIARARKRLSHPRGRNRVRVAGRGYARGSGTGVQAVRCLDLTGDGTMAKYIFVTGGVVSSLGKGIAAASIGCLLESRGLQGHAARSSTRTSTSIPGTMSPFQHGEVFVTDDGAETDLDLGHYERFTHAPPDADQQPDPRPHLRADHHPRAPRRLPGQDRAGDSARHQRDQGRRAQGVATDVDVVIVEIGGTVGDIESLPFLEAIRQMRHEVGPRQHACSSTSPWCRGSPPRRS